ncbi:hypothetical protein [uncultured Hyphomonas sp.]|uniref:hypothetical protein n=1 Tax=uncultured Hyphomonas sp. TaxID=225298 RepID=UPI002AABABA5|nr:hypothetical protein [uncultured Hyphomonas sp.]
MKPALISIVLAATLSASAEAKSPREDALWLEDIDSYVTGLESNHIDLYHQVSRDEFARQLDLLREDLPELTDAEIVAALMKITHSVGDGHTSMPLWNSEPKRFPIQIRWIGGEAVITGTTADNAELLGAVVKRWNGLAIDAVYERLAPYVPFVENKHSEAVRVGQYLTFADLGHAIGISTGSDRVTIEVSQGADTREIQLEALDPQELREQLSEKITYRHDLNAEPTMIKASGIRFVLLEGGATGYIQFDSYPEPEEMREFANSVFEALEAANAQNIVIDFRESFGGNYFVGLMLAAELVALDGIDWRHGTYVLISGITFSAAMSNSAQFANILNAKLVGEPTGANPCGYQDMGQFELPNSGRLVTYSKREYCFANSVDGALQPDVPVPLVREDYVTGNDPAMNWILGDIAARREKHDRVE